MDDHANEMSPFDIRAIREKLGLTQTEAGEIIGGGPRAFTKYEAGSVKPATAVINLLRLLDVDPTAIRTLRPDRRNTIDAVPTSPFEVSGSHVSALTDRLLPTLARRVLNSEAAANDLPCPVVHVASNINAPDGGEDGRITWEAGPTHTQFLPSRICQFQFKAGHISPAAAGNDVLSRDRSVKAMVRTCLERGGHYIMLCTHSYTRQQIEARETNIREALRNAGMAISDEQVRFMDADQIADWVNRHPPIATWLKEQTQPGIVGPFRSWIHWAGRTEHEQSPWVDDDRLRDFVQRLHRLITGPDRVARVVGLSGVGKSRLALEALGDDESSGYSLSDQVMYTTLSESNAETVINFVQNLASSGQSAVLVVDDCDVQVHRILSSAVQRRGSALSLITINDDVAVEVPDEATINVDKAPSSVTEGIIRQALPAVPSEDRRRLERFSSGFPRISNRVSLIWPRSEPIANATDDDLVDAFVLGHRPLNPDILLHSAEVLAVFGVADTDPPGNEQLCEMAGLGHNLDPDHFGVAVRDLADRGIGQTRGRFFRLQPTPITMKLAARQWRRWTPSDWDLVLAGTLNSALKTAAARQLALLDALPIADQVVRHVCRYGGPFDSAAGLLKPGHCEVLSSLAEINAEVVVDQLERSLAGFDNLASVAGDKRRHLVWALSKIAFRPDTFEEGADLLLRLAVAENEDSAGNATTQFQGLFPVLLAYSAADGETRLDFLDGISGTDLPDERLIVAKALSAGITTDHFTRIGGVESQGTRPALQSWAPHTQKDKYDYIAGCLTRLAAFALQDDAAGILARTKLGHALRSLIRNGLIDVVTDAVRMVNDVVDYWPEADRSLKFLLQHDADQLDANLMHRIRLLSSELEPRSLESRVQTLVTDMAWLGSAADGEAGFETLIQRQVDAVRELAAELIAETSALPELIRQLSRGRQTMTYVLGQELAALCDPPLNWLDAMVRAVLEPDDAERNFDLLVGYVAGVADRIPGCVDTFKRAAVESTELGPGFANLAARLGISESDIDLAVAAMNEGTLLPRHLQIWSYGSVLSEVSASAVAKLVDGILGHGAAGFAVALELMGMYGLQNMDKLDGLRPQVLKIAECCAAQDPGGDPIMTEHHFKEVMGWILEKGRGDDDARSVALTLTKNLVDADGINYSSLTEQVLPALLCNFPEISWALIGQAIVSDGDKALHLRLTMGGGFSFGHNSIPFVSYLPEDTLFAWCHAHPDEGPAFAGGVLPVLTTLDRDAPERELHPAMARLIDEFGERIDVQRVVESNMHSFGWSGSVTDYYAMYDAPMRELLQHSKPEVRRWARAMLRRLDSSSQDARVREEEMKIQWE